MRDLSLLKLIQIVHLISILLVTLGGLLSCSNPPSPQGNSEYSIDLCVLTTSNLPKDGSHVTVNGKIAGYHELFLYSDDCFGNEHLIELQFSDQERERLEEMSKPYRHTRPDIEGQVVVSGRFYQQKGQLLTYPARPVDIENLRTSSNILRVHKIAEAKIINYIPQ